MRFLQIGLGSWGRRWAELVQVTDGYEIAAVVDPDPASRAWAMETLRLPAEAIFAEPDAALRNGGVTAALITTPPETHRAVAETALMAGLHVLVEKPLATTLADAEAMAAAAEASGKTLMVSQNYRYTWTARAVREQILRGDAGELLGVRVRFRRDTRAQFREDDFRYRMRHPLVLDMAIHHFDLLRAITGLEPLTVDARSWRVPDSPYTHDPACAALMTLTGGIPVIYDGDWAAHGRETSWNGDWELTGSKGRLTWQDDTIALSRWGKEEVAPVPIIPEPTDGRIGVLDAFADSLNRGSIAETDVRDNIQSLALTLGCVASIETGAPVEVARLLQP